MSASLFRPITFASGDCSGAEPFRTAASLPLVGSALRGDPSSCAYSAEPVAVDTLPLYVAARLGDPPGTSSPHVDIRSRWRTSACLPSATVSSAAPTAAHGRRAPVQGSSVRASRRGLVGSGEFYAQFSEEHGRTTGLFLGSTHPFRSLEVGLAPAHPGSIGAHLTPWLSGRTCAGDRPAL